MHLCPAFVILKNSYEIQYVKKKKKKNTFLFSPRKIVSKRSRAPIYPRGNNLWYRVAQDTSSTFKFTFRVISNFARLSIALYFSRAIF